MIEDARVLNEEFIPQEIEHRNDELNRLSRALAPCLSGGDPENTVLYGPSGTGKTCLARYALDQLHEQSPDIDTQYVNCWQNYSRYRVSTELLAGLGVDLTVNRHSTAKDEYPHLIEDTLDGPYVVILDEVDQLQESEVLYDLHRLSQVTMILIANRETELFYNLDERVASRLKGAVRLEMNKYSVDELVEILHARVRRGLAPESIGTEQLRVISDIAAGDARVGLSILRAAAKYAESDGRDTITESVIEQVVPDAREVLRKKNIEKLNGHQVTLFELLKEHGPASPGDLVELYEEAVDDPMSGRTVRNYLSKMEQYRVIESVGRSRSKRYQIPT